jgi:glycosyltransferase involved in cell wall biosynthesis
MAEASVVVPARDAADTLPATLAALEEQYLAGGFEVVVVDNGSADGTRQLAESSPIVSRVIRRQRGSGPGPARNAGALAASAPVLAFLDADCVPAPGWLASGMKAVAQAELVQGRVLPDPNATVGPFDRTLSVGGAYGLFESANLFVRRDLFERLGGFPDGLEPAAETGDRAAPFGEDVIFGWRVVRSGARTGFCPDALAYHAVFPRGPLGFLSERRRVGLFAQLAKEVPELRERFFYRRVFLSGRSAALDLALAGALSAAIVKRPMLLLAVAPYASLLAARARRWGRRAPAVAAIELLADVVSAAALIETSIRTRSILL